MENLRTLLPSASNLIVFEAAGRHGNFTPDQRTRIFATIREFLAKNKLM